MSLLGSLAVSRISSNSLCGVGSVYLWQYIETGEMQMTKTESSNPPIHTETQRTKTESSNPPIPTETVPLNLYVCTNMSHFSCVKSPYLNLER